MLGVAGVAGVAGVGDGAGCAAGGAVGWAGWFCASDTGAAANITIAASPAKLRPLCIGNSLFSGPSAAQSGNALARLRVS